jgi:starch-binding outer membrane protein, SusD/RagB family
MKNRIYILCLICTSLFTGCQDVVDGLNDDPNNFTDTNLSLILNHSLLNVASIAEADPARYTSIFTDQFMGVDRQYGTLNGYSVTQANFDDHWEDFYQRGIAQVQIAKEKAIDAGNPIAEGQALILEGYYFAEAALLFGDIPFSEANNVEEFPDPAYESQTVVINGAINLITEGIGKAGSSPAANDVFTTSSTWSQVGNALLARYYLALKQYPLANTAAKAANFTSNANDWAISHSSANYGENLFWQFEVEQRADYLKVANGTDFSYMLEMLDVTHPNYKGNAKTTEAGRYAYYADGQAINTTDGFAAQTASFPVTSFEEVQLIIAETELLLPTPDPAAAIAALNLVRANNITRFGGTYDDYIAADFATNAALRLEILKEKFCLVIGLPTFQDVNRTNNLIGTTIKNSNQTRIPQRFLYPSTESSSNDNAPDVVDFFQPTAVNQ